MQVADTDKIGHLLDAQGSILAQAALHALAGPQRRNLQRRNLQRLKTLLINVLYAPVFTSGKENAYDQRVRSGHKKILLQAIDTFRHSRHSRSQRRSHSVQFGEPRAP